MCGFLRRRVVALVVTLPALCAFGPLPAQAAALPWTAEAAVSRQAGDYGTDAETTAWYLLAGLSRRFSRGEAGVVVPLVYTSTAYTVVDTTTTPMGRPRSDNGTETVTASGLGDVQVQARWYAFETAGYGTTLDVAATVKLPTGDADKGLGTGSLDVTAGVALTHFVSANGYVYLDPAYTWFGEPDAGLVLKDRWQANAGGGYYLRAPYVLNAGYTWREAAVPGGEAERELLAGVSGTGHAGWRAAFNRGLSDSVPDWGVTVGYYMDF